MRDPYQILGVERKASAAEIKSAYRRLAKKLHPDVNQGKKDVEAQFKEVSAAYDLLSDPTKRARFDRGEVDAQGQERGFGGGGDPFGGMGGHARSHTRTYGSQAGNPFGGASGMEDFFSEFFGGAAKGQRSGFGGTAAKGADVTYALSVPLVKACLGDKRRLTLSNNKTIEINIPPGTEEGHKLRLRGQGTGGPGGAGDAIIEIHVEPHALFTRRDNDILLDLPVSLPESIMGAQIKVPTLDGHVTVKIPKGSNTDSVLRLKGKGVPKAQGEPGDMFVKIKIALPDPVPKDLHDMVEKWAKKNAYDPRKKAGWIS